jgi:large subunit ribosomal protein L16
MLLPKKVKFRKWHVMRVNPKKKLVETRGTTLAYGSYGLKAETSARVLSNQIESARKAMSKELKKFGKVWTRIFPDMPYVGRSGEVGMGKGKGDPQGYQFIVKPGRILFEIDGVDEAVARKTLRLGADKLPVKTKIISRHI